MWQFIKDVPSAIKVGAGIVGGLCAGIATAWGLMVGPVSENADAIESNLIRINHFESSLDTMRADMTLVRCWARHEIQDTDPTECLFPNGRVK